MLNITVNGQRHQLDVDPNTPILWVLREELNLLGTKYGCGIAACGICTILVNNEPVRACVLPISEVVDKEILTIEGLASGDKLHPVQQAWLDAAVPECGYCQPGQIMAAVALLNSNPRPDDAAIESAMSGVLCRCGTYQRIKQAIKQVVAMGDKNETDA